MARVSSIDPSGHFDHLYAHLHHLIVEYFVVESHHGSFLYFPTSLVNSKNSKKLLSHTTTVLRAKSLILACAYVGFFPVLYHIAVVIF